MFVSLPQVQNVEDATFEGWFKTLEFAWQWDSYKIDGLVDIKTVPPIKATVKTSEPEFRSSVTGQEISFAECIQPGLDQLFATLPQVQEITDAPRLLNITPPLEVALEDQVLRVTQLLVPVRISREIVNAKALLNICHNVGEDRIEGLTGICRLHMRDHDLKVLVAATPSKIMPDHYDLRVTVLGADDQPVPLPAGTTVTLYGIQKEPGEQN